MEAKRVLHIEQLGEIDYDECLALQKDKHRAVHLEKCADTLFVCSHPAIVTSGSSTKPEHLLTSSTDLLSLGIRVANVGRGGSVTYHGPEQLVAYPVIDLSHHRKDVAWYMRSLEQVILNLLHAIGISGKRIEGKTGVWINDHSKIAFIGVKISRWCTYHGFSLNVFPCADKFRLIDPCGLGDIEVTSVASELSFPPPFCEVQKLIEDHFCEVFGYNVRQF